MYLLLEQGEGEQSRNGNVFLYPYPLTTLYERPTERVVFWHERDANPFFHFMEGLLFIGGRCDVEAFALYVKQIREYSDDGQTLPASYGVRWRNHFRAAPGVETDLPDQLSWAIRRLRADPNDRRVVISMWNGSLDPVRADAGTRDVPCNVSIFLNVRGGRLCMQVNCRSNDAILGLTGANAVHMSMLQEYLAGHIGVPMGWYAQNSFNMHAYEEFWKKILNERTALDERTSLRNNMTLPAEERWNPYSDLPGLATFPMVAAPDQAHWDEQLTIFLAGGSGKNDGLTDPFFTAVAAPVRDAHAAYRAKQYDTANEIITACAAPDWRQGCQDWFARRALGRAVKPSPGPNPVHPEG